jgi:RNA 2',3'-cyclic 3'-phosphodiesterase
MAFIGMRVPAQTAAQFAAIQVPGIREPQESMHLTLAFLGNSVPVESILNSINVCLAVASQLPPIELTAAAVMCFSPDPEGKTPVIARIVTPALFNLRKILVDTLEIDGVEYSKRHPQYKPHVTLAYADQMYEPMVIKPIKWQSDYITIWGGDKEKELISAEIQLRG